MTKSDNNNVIPTTTMKFQRAFHQSDIERYLICPYQFYLKEYTTLEKEYRNPYAIRGTIDHKMINAIHQNQWWNTPELIAKYYRIYFEQEELAPQNPNEQGLPVFWEDEQQREKMINESITILNNYILEDFNRNANVLFSEVNFRVKIGYYYFEGRIDQIRKTDNGLILVDFKHTNKTPSQFVIDFSYQLSIYAYAMWKGELNANNKWIKLNQLPHECIWYHLANHYPKRLSSNNRGPVLFKTKRTKDSLQIARKHINDICKSINQNIFPKRPMLLGSCQGFCNFQAQCYTNNYTHSFKEFNKNGQN